MDCNDYCGNRCNRADGERNRLVGKRTPFPVEENGATDGDDDHDEADYGADRRVIAFGEHTKRLPAHRINRNCTAPRRGTVESDLY